MKKAKKVVALALCAVMLVVGSVAGTMAYLQDKDEVVNTFTVGKVDITLDEAKVGADGKAPAGAERVTENSYKLMPGSTYDKDPIIHVAADSENCWLFVEIDNALVNIEADTKIAAQMAANGWTLVEGNVYSHAVVAGGTDVPVFQTFTIKGDVDNNTLANYQGETIKVTAYAVQADNFASAQDAWTATYGAPANS